MVRPRWLVFALASGVLAISPTTALRALGGPSRLPARDAASRLREYGRAYTLAHGETTPSFARQTGLSCEACHTDYPELTAMGRLFKLNGYVMRGADSLQGRNAAGRQNMLLNLVAPVSIMVQTSYTRTATAQPGTQNGTIFFPDQLSLFMGGEISTHVGGFLQVTFDPQTGTLGVDNADFRFASHPTLLSQPSVVGISLNNNPTVQDLWSTTPAWGFPYASSAAAPTPAGSALIDGQLGQRVGGMTVYGMWNDRVYAEVGGYGAAPAGINRPIDSADPTAVGLVQGVAPYWRLAFPNRWGRHYLSIGAYGISARVAPGSITGPTNRFTDIAADFAYFVTLGANSLSINGTWIHERQRWDAGGTVNATNSLSTFRFDAMYHLGHRWALTIAPFMTTGTQDTLLYVADPMDGSRTGRPDSNGATAEVDIMPWQNLRLQFQYVIYGKFNGEKTDYDGFGRNASDNNTLYIVTWLLF
jgi:hypothetical protein